MKIKKEEELINNSIWFKIEIGFLKTPKFGVQGITHIMMLSEIINGDLTYVLLFNKKHKPFIKSIEITDNK